jgi:hypothetical protein
LYSQGARVKLQMHPLYSSLPSKPKTRVRKQFQVFCWSNTQSLG